MALVNESYDEIEMTYISGGAADGKLGSVIYKWQSKTVSTIILDYDSNGKLVRATKV
jgi:hypothetical protein